MFFPINCAGKNESLLLLHLRHQINSRWTVNPNIKAKTISFVMKTGKYLSEFGVGNNLVNETPKMMTTQEKYLTLLKQGIQIHKNILRRK